MPNRRDFLKTTARASTGLILTGCGISSAMAAGMPAQAAGFIERKEAMVGNRRVKTVDIHCHVGAAGKWPVEQRDWISS